MISPRQVVSALGTAARNRDVRRVELAWGAAIAAEWMHFVALGVFAYEEGGTSAVGVAGLVRLLPAAIIAPFAASLGDRFRRERFLLALTLLGAAALAGSAAAAFAGQRVVVFALAAVVGLVATLFRPALQALLPSLAHTPEELIASNGATSTIEGLGTLVGPILAGVFVAAADAGVVFAVAAGVLFAGSAMLALVRVEGRIDLTAESDDASVRRLLSGGVGVVLKTKGASMVVGLIVAQTFVRGCVNVLIVVAVFQVFHGSAAQVGYLTAAIGVGGLIGALGAMTLKGRRLAAVVRASRSSLGHSAHPDRAEAVPRRDDFPACGRRGREQPRGRRSVHAAAADRPGRDADARARSRLGPSDGWSCARLDRGAGRGGPGRAAAAFAVVGSILPLLTLITYRRLVELDSVVAPAAELELIESVPMFAPISLAAKEHVVDASRSACLCRRASS